MSDMSFRNRTPNLLELFETHVADANVVWGFDTASCEGKISGSRADGSLVSGSNDLSICDDAKSGTFSTLSLCSDESSDFSSAPSPLKQLSLCADEGGDDSNLSDVRLKTDIDHVGTTVYGLPLYQFRYKTGPERYEGVMAQDVLEVMPDAVRMGEDGFYRVNYGRLGIRMTRA